MIRRSVPVLCFCILLLSVVGSYAQTKKSTKSQTRINPVLLIEYDPSKAIYERFPTVFLHTCAKLLADETDQMIYARVRLGFSDYLAEMGHFSDPEREDSFNIGDTIWIQGDNCQPLGIDFALSAQPPKTGYRTAASKETFPGTDSPQECSAPGECHPVFRSAKEELLLRSFVKDAIQRAITAYGGDAPFRAQACKPQEKKELTDAGYVIVLQGLQEYCSKTLVQK